ncbi:MAG: hypothetical protein K8J31_17960 [Anaerolineae bacterium]|nr:hypothetical protein [Anaerolineae bacterium]
MEPMINELMAKIHTGMTVRDVTGDEIGHVADVQMGDEDPTNADVETATNRRPQIRGNTLVDDVARVFASEEYVPDELEARMQRYGFIRIDSGLLQSDRYAMSDQIGGVTRDGVTLNVHKDALVEA